MSNEDWKQGFGLCDCTDEICETVSGDRSTHSHKDGNCHHPNGTHHPIHSRKEEKNCPKCNAPLKASLGCHVHSNQCCSKCDWGK